MMSPSLYVKSHCNCYRLLEATKVALPTFAAFIRNAARTLEVALRPRFVMGSRGNVTSSFSLGRAAATARLASAASLRMSSVDVDSRAALRVRRDDMRATE